MDSEEGSDFEMETTAPKKAPDVTSLEQTLLLDLINEYKHIIEDKSKKFGSNDTKQKTWDVIATRFSSQQGVSKRTGKQIRVWWDNKKKRAKKSVTKKKRAARKTGGGTNDFQIPADAERVISMIPSQMNSLENRFDSDFQPLADETLDDDRHVDEEQHAENGPQHGHDKENVDPSSVPKAQATKRKYKDARSSLTDMEYEEHKVRLKVLYTQLEESQMQRDLARSTAEFRKEEQKLTLEILRIKLQQRKDMAFSAQDTESGSS